MENGSDGTGEGRKYPEGTDDAAFESMMELPLREVADTLVLSFFDLQGPTGLWVRMLLYQNHLYFDNV